MKNFTGKMIYHWGYREYVLCVKESKQLFVVKRSNGIEFEDYRHMFRLSSYYKPRSEDGLKK